MSIVTCPDTLELECGPVTAVKLALFAGASGDHNPLHLDADVANAAGFDRPVVHGMFSLACAGRLFSAHFGAGSIRALSARFTGIAKRGDSLLFMAQLGERDATSATYTLRCCTGLGDEVLTGSARVALSTGG
jgi:acyl dehydratase